MKTILVIYTNKKVESKKEIAKQKKYSFNCEDNVNEGDMIDCKEYQTPLQVVKVLDQAFKYYNASTGELSDNFTSTSQWEIRRLILRDEDEEIVYGKLR